MSRLVVVENIFTTIPWSIGKIASESSLISSARDTSILVTLETSAESILMVSCFREVREIEPNYIVLRMLRAALFTYFETAPAPRITLAWKRLADGVEYICLYKQGNFIIKDGSKIRVGKWFPIFPIIKIILRKN